MKLIDKSLENIVIEPLKQQIIPLMRTSQSDCCPDAQASLQVPTEVPEGPC